MTSICFLRTAGAEWPVLAIDELRVVYRTGERQVYAVDGASLAVGRGEAVGLIGESGCGKSTIARAAMGLLPPGRARIAGGRIRIEQLDVTSLNPQGWQRLRGHPVAIVFQDPLSSLNPVMRVGRQIAESIRRHDRAAPSGRVAELLELVRLPPAAARCFPHQLSGGMRQRVLLAIALGCRPRLLIADEPTTALDATTRTEILDLLGELRRQFDMALLLISHDLEAIAASCDRIIVMYGGRTVESGRPGAVFGTPAHPYTENLLLAAHAVRNVHGRFQTIEGEVPDLARQIPGCPFAPRCPDVHAPCHTLMPPERQLGDCHSVQCWRPG